MSVASAWFAGYLSPTTRIIEFFLRFREIIWKAFSQEGVRRLLLDWMMEISSSIIQKLALA